MGLIHPRRRFESGPRYLICVDLRKQDGKGIRYPSVLSQHKKEQTLTSGLFGEHRAVWLSIRQHTIGADW